MEKLFKFICDVYQKVTRRVPLGVLHVAFVFISALFSIPFAVGLSLGRESMSFSSTEMVKDSIGDLVADAVGIALAVFIRWLFHLIMD